MSTTRILGTTITTPSSSYPLDAEVGGSLPGILSDASTSTYVRGGAGASHQSILRFGLSAASLPANEFGSGLRYRHTACGEDATTRYALTVLGHHPSSGAAYPALGIGQWSFYGSTTPTEQTGGWQTTTALFPQLADAQWTNTNLTGVWFEASLLNQTQTATSLRVHEFAVELQTTTIPVATVSVTGLDRTRPAVTLGQTDLWSATVTTKALTSNVATLTTSTAHGFLPGNQVAVTGVDSTFNGSYLITATTTYTFSYARTASNVTSQAATGTVTIGDNKPYTTYDLRIFDQATYSAAGFDPATATPVGQASQTDSGKTTSVTVNSPTDLVNGTYRVYVRTQYGTSWWTTWAYAAFTVAVTPATPATLVASWDTGTQAATLVVTTHGNLIPPDYATAENALGASWQASSCTITRVSDSGAHGSYATEITASSTSTATATIPYTTGIINGVIAGERYLLKVPVKAVTQTKAVTATIAWYTAAYALISSVSSSSVSPTTSDGWTKSAVINAVAPAGAAVAQLQISIASPTASAKWRVDAMVLCIGDAADDPATLSYGQGGTGAGLSGFRTLVEHSADQVIWEQVRAPAGTDQTAYGVLGQRLTIVDGEAPRGTVYYRASLVGTSPGIMVSTNTAQSLATTTDGTWWLKNPTTPAANRGGIQLETKPKFTVAEQATVFRPIGRGYPVVVATDIGGEDGQGTIHTRTPAEHAAVLALLRTQGALLLQSPFTDTAGNGLQWFIRLLQRSWDLDGVPTAPHRPISVQWVDVGRPTVGA